MTTARGLCFSEGIKLTEAMSSALTDNRKAMGPTELIYYGLTSCLRDHLTMSFLPTPALTPDCHELYVDFVSLDSEKLFFF